MTEILFMIEEYPTGGYVAHAAGVPIFTQGDTIEQVREEIKDAVHCHFDPGTEPSIIHLHFVRDEVMTL